MTPFYYGLGIGIIIGCNIGIAMAKALKGLKRMALEHHLMTLPEPYEKLKEVIRCNIKNNKKFNDEQRLKIINKGE